MRSASQTVPLEKGTNGTTGALAPFWPCAFFFSALSMLIPKAKFAGVWVGADDFLSVSVWILLGPILALHGERRESKAFWVVVLSFVGFVTFFTLFGLLNSLAQVGHMSFPTELWQYLKRGAFFVVGYYLVVNSGYSPLTGYRWLLWSALAACAIGAIQYTGGELAHWLAHLYGRDAGQVENLLERSMADRRVFGVSGFSTAWGGLAAFFLALSLPCVLLGRKRVGGQLFVLAGATSALAVLNILGSGSRAAIAAALVSTSVTFTIFMSSRAASIVRKAGLVTAAAASVIVVLSVLDARIQFLLYRFDVLIKRAGGMRIEQIRHATDLLDSPWEWVIGVGNTAQRTLAVDHGVEVEPIYLLVNYGVVGLGALITMLVVIFATAWKLARMSHSTARVVGLSVIGALSSYVTFWFGYFFFQEIAVGGVPWLLFGLGVGLSFRARGQHNKGYFEAASQYRT